MNVDQGGTWARSITHQNTYTPDTIHGGYEGMETAPCTRVPPETFYVETGQSVEKAKTVCDPCQFRQPCLSQAMRIEGTFGSRARYGVYAGLSPSERAKLHTRGWKAGDPLPPIRHYGQQSTGDAA